MSNLKKIILFVLNILNVYSTSRKYWILLIISVIYLECVAIFLQNVLSLKPCILCIYQRCALYGIAIAGLIATISPNYILLRMLSIFIWIYSAGKGFFLAKEQINLQLYPSPFSKCDLFVTFPQWLPLNKWFPIIFDTNHNDCSIHKWYFLSLETSQWMLIIFSIYFIIGFFVCVSQIIKIKS